MARAMPKSMTLTWPDGVSMTLAGLMSRWMMPLAVAVVERAEHVGGDRQGALGQDLAAVLGARRMSRSVWPSTYSMTMYGMWLPWVSIGSPVS